MSLLSANVSFNATLAEINTPYDVKGAMMYIIGVLVWYAMGVALILFDDIKTQPGRGESDKHVSLHQTVSDLHEHEAKSDLLVELKDPERRTKLWQIYYGTQKTHPITVQKDMQAVESIKKQINDLNDRRRSLRHVLHTISDGQEDPDRETDDDDNLSAKNVRIKK